MTRLTNGTRATAKKDAKSRRAARKVPRGDFAYRSREEQMALVSEDYKAAYQLLESGALDQQSGRFVAVLGGRLVGSGRNSMDLRTRISRKCRVDPERLAIIHVFDEAAI